jgi:transcriptional regulator with XRE-family HTH domain
MTTTPGQRTGANVRAELARQRLTQIKLAAHLEMSQQAVSKRLLGLVPFDIDELTATAAFLGVPVASLLSDEPVAAA